MSTYLQFEECVLDGGEREGGREPCTKLYTCWERSELRSRKDRGRVKGRERDRGRVRGGGRERYGRKRGREGERERERKGRKKMQSHTDINMQHTVL